MAFTREERIKQLKACAETIKNNAARIITDDEFTQNWKVTIVINCNEVPHITAKRDFVSKEIIESLKKAPRNTGVF